jgi:hypothetical protein
MLVGEDLPTVAVGLSAKFERNHGLTREGAGVILRPVRMATIEGAEETSNKVRIEDTRSEGNASIADVEKSWECLVEAKGDY